MDRVVSQHADVLLAVQHGWGAYSRPEDCLGAFQRLIQDKVKHIAALQIVLTRPRDLTGEHLRALMVALAQHQFTETAVRTAWSSARHEDIAATLIGYIRQLALGSPLATPTAGLLMDYIQAFWPPLWPPDLPAVLFHGHPGGHPMRYSTQVKSISYLKANAADMLDKLAEQREPVLITQNGEARAVLQDVASYEEMQDTLALLKMLALGDREIEQGQVQPLAEAVSDLRVELRKEFGAGA